MLPVFPNFKTIELSDYEAIEKFTKQFPPYNDFEFMSLWTYNMGSKNAVSTLHGNLVVKIQDFIKGDFFYSYIGTNNPKDTISTLLDKSKEDNFGTQLNLIPEINITSSADLEKYFSIKEDLDSFEYILSVDEVVNLEGSKYHEKRNLVNTFKKLYLTHIVKVLDLTEEKTQQDIKELFYHWEKQKGKERDETIIELTAIERLFDLVNILKIKAVGIYIEGKLIGFATYHVVGNNYAILSFEKGDTDYRGIYELLNQEVAKQLKTFGALYINYEQDLGIPGLRKSKMLWHPVFFLKKYIIQDL